MSAAVEEVSVQSGFNLGKHDDKMMHMKLIINSAEHVYKGFI